jgi:phosphoribosylamine--glycine ligase/phosphoribosylformylglycinamidine cyclo-ligase
LPLVLSNIQSQLADLTRIDVASWELPAVFKWLKQAGNVSATEMARTFNTGVGMVAVVKKK